MHRLLSAWCLVALLGLGLVGCAPYGWEPRPAERVVVRPAPTPASARSVSSREVRRVQQDARQYANTLRRPVGLDRRQQQMVERLVADHAVYLLERTHPRDRAAVYPFPRHYGNQHRSVQRFWRDVDRSVEQTLDRRQRRAYRDAVRALEARPQNRGNQGRGNQGRGRSANPPQRRY